MDQASALTASITVLLHIPMEQSFLQDSCDAVGSSKATVLNGKCFKISLICIYLGIIFF